MIKCDEIDNSLKYFRDNGINAKNTAMKNDFADFIGHSTVTGTPQPMPLRVTTPPLTIYHTAFAYLLRLRFRSNSI